MFGLEISTTVFYKKKVTEEDSQASQGCLDHGEAGVVLQVVVEQGEEVEGEGLLQVQGKAVMTSESF